MKKRKYRFYWEEPIEKIEKKARSIFDEPFELRFAIPRIEFPSMRAIHVGIGQTDKEVIIKSEILGFKKDEISLNITRNHVEIRAAKKEERKKIGKNFFRLEQSASALSRSFTLPAEIDENSAKAKLEDGVLEIIAPKLHKKKKKRVEVE